MIFTFHFNCSREEVQLFLLGVKKIHYTKKLFFNEDTKKIKKFSRQLLAYSNLLRIKEGLLYLEDNLHFENAMKNLNELTKIYGNQNNFLKLRKAIIEKKSVLYETLNFVNNQIEKKYLNLYLSMYDREELTKKINEKELFYFLQQEANKNSMNIGEQEIVIAKELWEKGTIDFNYKSINGAYGYFPKYQEYHKFFEVKAFFERNEEKFRLACNAILKHLLLKSIKDNLFEKACYGNYIIKHDYINKVHYLYEKILKSNKNFLLNFQTVNKPGDEVIEVFNHLNKEIKKTNEQILHSSLEFFSSLEKKLGKEKQYKQIAKEIFSSVIKEKLSYKEAPKIREKILAKLDKVFFSLRVTK